MISPSLPRLSTQQARSNPASPAAETIREGVVSRYVIEGSGGLGVPIAPGFAAIGGNYCPLIADEQNDIRVIGIEPALLIIVAAGCAADGGPGETRIFGSPENGRAAVNNLVVLRIDRDGVEESPPPIRPSGRLSGG